MPDENSSNGKPLHAQLPDDSFGTPDSRKAAAINSPGRRAMLYTGLVVALALVLTAVFAALTAGSPSDCRGEDVFGCMSINRYLLTFAPVSVLALGGVSAFVKTYLVWRSGGPWKVWHASGWFLFVLMLAFASVAGGSLTA